MEMSLNCPEQFQYHFMKLSKYIHQKKLRRRLMVLLVTDLSMLLCFGVLFPPLAIVIGFSVIKDIMNVRISLGKYYGLMNAVQDESLKTQMMQLKDTMDNEILVVGENIWSGIWYGVILATWIWAFILFDTIASSVDIVTGLGLLLVMIACPFILSGLQKVVGVAWNMRTRSMEKTKVLKQDTFITIENPIMGKTIDKEIEMKVKNDTV
jgi:hypothetical protein